MPVVTLKTYKGSCHCGSISYEADIDLSQGTGKCNCTFCMKTRAGGTFVKPAAFSLLTGADSIKTYRKHPQAPLEHFCRECGVMTYGIGSADYMGGDSWPCLSPRLMMSSLGTCRCPCALFRRPAHNWQNPPAETRYL